MLGPPGSRAARTCCGPWKEAVALTGSRGRLRAASSLRGAEHARPRPGQRSLTGANADGDGGRGLLGAACRARGTARGLCTHTFVQLSQWHCGVGITVSSMSWMRKPEPKDTRKWTKVSRPESGWELGSASASGRGLSTGRWCVTSFQSWLWL